MNVELADPPYDPDDGTDLYRDLVNDPDNNNAASLTNLCISATQTLDVPALRYNCRKKLHIH